MTPISFFARGEPKAQPRPKAFARKMGTKFVARVYTPGTAENWKSCVAEAAKPFVEEMLMDPLWVSMTFLMPRPKSHFNSKGDLKATAPIFHAIKPDGDNLYKGTVDALKTLGLISDDSIVVQHEVTKLYAANFVTGAQINIKPAFISQTAETVGASSKVEDASRTEEIAGVPPVCAARNLADRLTS